MTMMTPEQLQEAIDLYSADLSRWPGHLLPQAAQLLSADPAARARLEAAGTLDAALWAYEPAVQDLQALEARIFAAVRDMPAQETHAAPVPSRGGWSAGWLLAPGGGLLAAALVGFIVGIMPAKTTPQIEPLFYAEESMIVTGEPYEGVIF